MKVPYVAYVTQRDECKLNPASFPGNLPFTQNLHLDFDSPVTFFVGENGSGKSTLLEVIDVAGPDAQEGASRSIPVLYRHALADSDDLSQRHYFFF